MVILLGSCDVRCTIINVDTNEMSLEEASYILVVKSLETLDNIEKYYLDDEVPMTVFNVEVIHSFKGTTSETMSVSLLGGYDKYGRFYGSGNGGITNCDNEYNLFEDDHYYLVILYEGNGYNHGRYRSELVEYDESVGPYEQSDTIVNIFSSYGIIEGEETTYQ
jgi:hypothetical protein